MTPLIDGDILRYEVGYAAETGWRAITGDEEALPPFEYVLKHLEGRLSEITKRVGADKAARLFITEGRTFRYDIAKRKPYKGTRADKRPWHFENLTMWMKLHMNAEVVRHIEADDMMAIEAMKDVENTIICTRDKDLKQVPCNVYSWELWKQPEFGPTKIHTVGNIRLIANDKKLSIKGEGLAFFYAQVLMGDAADNIPGLPGCGPKKTYDILWPCVFDADPEESMYNAVLEAYEEYYYTDGDPEAELLEQGRLCWMVRELDDNGDPVMWELGKDK